MSSRVVQPPRLTPGVGRALYWVLVLAVILVVLVVASPSASWAQAVTGTLLGAVTDAQGAAVPGATVTVTETGPTSPAPRRATRAGTTSSRTSRTAGIGWRWGCPASARSSATAWRWTSTPPCAWTSSSRWGSSWRRSTVVEETPPLQTDRADTGRIIESRQITEMPLGFNRNFQGMWSRCRAHRDPVPSALAVLQLAGQPVDQVQRPVRACQQRAARRHRQQPQDGPAHRHHSVRGGHRLRQREHLATSTRSSGARAGAVTTSS